MNNIIKEKVYHKNRFKRLFVLTDEWSTKGYWIAKDKGQWVLVQYSFNNQVSVSSNLQGIDRHLDQIRKEVM